MNCRPKLKKKRRREGIASLENVSYFGELFQKGMLSLTKKLCFIANDCLLCFRAEKDSKPFVNICLRGYDIIYVEKDGKFNHAIRISHPGCETHWFYAESKEVADVWLTVGYNFSIREYSITYSQSSRFCQLHSKVSSYFSDRSRIRNCQALKINCTC